MTARILVVDDLVPNVKLMEARLTAEYYDVITAGDGPTALAKVEAEMPDIVLLDVMMPGMDGYEVCAQLKNDSRFSHIPIVMVTALSGSEERVRALEAGADDFLTEPVDDLTLLARIRSLVRFKAMIDEWRLRETTSSSLGVVQEPHLIQGESGEAGKVLLIDDNQINIDRIIRIIKENTTLIQVARSQEEASAQLHENKFDVILISLHLKYEDGLRICGHIRVMEESRHLPILLITEQGNEKQVARGLDLGANDYVLRPLESNELRARVRGQVRRKRYQDRLRQNYADTVNMALTDGLTGLYNRRYLNVHLEGMVEKTRQSGKELSVAIFDIDHFKHVNDTYMHVTGDEVLKELAERVLQNVRNFDLVARYGGEEFVVVMPETNADIATMVSERLREKIADPPFSVSAAIGKISITISVGVTSMINDQDTAADMLARSDAALYQAKNNGRNRVIYTK